MRKPVEVLSLASGRDSNIALNVSSQPPATSARRQPRRPRRFVRPPRSTNLRQKFQDRFARIFRIEQPAIRMHPAAHFDDLPPALPILSAPASRPFLAPPHVLFPPASTGDMSLFDNNPRSGSDSNVSYSLPWPVSPCRACIFLRPDRRHIFRRLQKTHSTSHAFQGPLAWPPPARQLNQRRAQAYSGFFQLAGDMFFKLGL